MGVDSRHSLRPLMESLLISLVQLPSEDLKGK